MSKGMYFFRRVNVELDRRTTATACDDSHQTLGGEEVIGIKSD